MTPMSDAQREMLTAVRRQRRLEREMRKDAAWKRREAAILSGRFRGPDGIVDERALDAFAPHQSELPKVWVKPLSGIPRPSLQSLKRSALRGMRR